MENNNDLLINITYLEQQNSRLKDEISNLSSSTISIVSDIESLNANIDITDFNKITEALTTNINNIREKLVNNLNVVSEFITQQMAEYKTASENATSSIDNLNNSLGGM